MTLRLTTCEELCRDKEAAKMIGKLYWDLEKSSTPTALLLPWFPSPSRRMNKKATRDLYGLILKFVQIRRAADTPTKDVFDVLIQRGDKDVDMVTVGEHFTFFKKTTQVLVLVRHGYDVRWRHQHWHQL